jgi:hypothetical protein
VKNITFICSAIISGTSMVAKVCMDNGAWFGTTEDSSSMIYDVYENARFLQLCRNTLGIDKDLQGENLFQLFQEFFDELPENETIVLKYPKSFYLLDNFKKMIGNDFKVVYVMRNPFTRATSIQKKMAEILSLTIWLIGMIHILIWYNILVDQMFIRFSMNGSFWNRKLKPKSCWILLVLNMTRLMPLR